MPRFPRHGTLAMNADDGTGAPLAPGLDGAQPFVADPAPTAPAPEPEPEGVDEPAPGFVQFVKESTVAELRRAVEDGHLDAADIAAAEVLGRGRASVLALAAPSK